jgi:hypothetical protein
MSGMTARRPPRAEMLRDAPHRFAASGDRRRARWACFQALNHSYQSDDSYYLS